MTPAPRRRWERDGFTIDTDPTRIDVAAVHRFLAEDSYWSPGITRERVERSIANSLCFGLHAPDGALAGFARVVTDYAVFAYLADVFVLPPWRGRGLGVWLVETVMGCPELQDLRRWHLATRDAHDLYRRFGFTRANPRRDMKRIDRDAHRR